MIELALAIIVIGIAFVLTLRGSEVIPAMRSFILLQQLQNYQMAIVRYQAEYHALPGDDVAGPSRWGRPASLYNLGGRPVSFVDDGKINGDLDDSGNPLGEQYLAWLDLRRAGFIDGDDQAVGQSAQPQSTHFGAFGLAEDNFGLNQVLCATRVNGDDARRIDEKLDDGNPGTGTVRATSKWDPSGAHNHFTTPDTDPYDPRKTYILCLSFLP
ncbi:MAG: type II secretion system protein [Candidatus Binataceae bacterium]